MMGLGHGRVIVPFLTPCLGLKVIYDWRKVVCLWRKVVCLWSTAIDISDLEQRMNYELDKMTDKRHLVHVIYYYVFNVS